MAKLILKFNGAIIKDIIIVGPETVIGRKPENELVIDNPAVSGRHARVVREESSGQYFIEDLNSTNGTYLLDRKVTRSVLRHKDVLVIAKHTVEFEDELEPAKPGPVIKETFSSEATTVMTVPPPSAKTTEKVGFVRVIEGEKNAPPYALKALTTYIGKADQAQIKLKGFFAPDLAACIAKKADGHSITALKDRAVKLNGDPLMDQAQVPLKEGDMIQVAGLKLMYYMEDPSAAGG